MNKIQKRLLIAVTVLICIVTQSGCTSKEPVFGYDFLMNTDCAIRIYDGGGSRSQQQELIKETFALCREYENRLSRTIEGSEVDRINRAAGSPVEISASTAEVIREGLKYAELSGGLFDITVGGVTELWDFQGENPSVPDARVLEQAVSHVGYEKVRFPQEEQEGRGDEDGGSEAGAQNGGEQTVTIQLTDPLTKLDLGGIAKGYIGDRAAEFLREKGVKSAVLDFGGNIICIGEKQEGTPFVIGVEEPFAEQERETREILGTVQAADQTVVTSGTYERKFYQDGKLYYHILDPKTGYPRETDLDGVTIMGSSSAACDGLSTSCLMLGLERGKALIESLPGVEAVFVTQDGAVTVTSGMELEPAE